MSMITLYCAFTCAVRDDWQALLPEPKKPGNVGEKKWLEERLPAKWKELEAGAPYHFLAGKVESVIALANNGTVAYDGDAVGFVKFLDGLASEAGDEVFIFSFDATDRMRHTLWTAAASGEVTPFWLWPGSSEHCYSDYAVKFASQRAPVLRLVDVESLTGAKGKKIPWDVWIRVWGIQPETAGESWQPIHTAEVVRGLVRRLGFGDAGE